MLQEASLLSLPSDLHIPRYMSYADWCEGPDESEEEDMGQELQRARKEMANYLNDTAGQAKTSLQLIRLLISHWASLDVISAFSASVGAKDIDLDLVCVKATYRHSGIGDWRVFIQALVNKASSDHPVLFSADDAIRELEDLLKSPDPALAKCKIVKAFNLADSGMDSEVRDFASGSDGPAANSLIPEQVKFKGTVHCEVALAIAKICGHILDDPALRKIIEVCSLIFVNHDAHQSNCLFRNWTFC